MKYTAEELAAGLARGDDGTDWDRVGRKTERQLAADTANDPAWSGIDDAWIEAAQIEHNGTINVVDKRQVTVRFDSDVVNYFKSAGRGWQDRMNAVLRRYMERES